MKMDQFHSYLDIRRANLDLDLFAAALALQHIRKLLASGGCLSGRPDLEAVVTPHHLELFLTQATENAQFLRYFAQEWQMLRRLIPHIKRAWEAGQSTFSQDMSRVEGQDEMEYLSQIDFAEFYASSAAKTFSKENTLLQQWVKSGYLRAWLDHFTEEEDE